MTVPSSVLQGVESALEAHSGKAVRIRSTAPVGGGCINPSAKLEAENGELYFLKWNPAAQPEMFGAEADGLTALASSGALRIPEVLRWGGSGTNSDPAWLLLEFIPQGRPGPDYGRRLGEGLADLHASALRTSDPGEGGLYGWNRDNFIGSLPQENDASEDWTTFWRDRRLWPQLRLARDRGHFTGRGGEVLDGLLARLDEVMAGAGEEGPALLHGDLWSGNFYAGPAGDPVLIDPALYRGAGEVDLAMMELFGSFPRGFREGYESRRELAPEYDAFRRDLYQLYYLLVHVNLFGGSYVSGSLAAAERALKGA
jgi:protein-ribulosamine 3-kinase